MATLIDSNVILDVVTPAAPWGDRSERALRASALRGPLLINDVIYAEVSPNFTRMEELDALVANLGFRHVAVPRAALFLAARASVDYRRRGGSRTGVLPDFFVGAHAAVAGLPLLTRDVARFRTNFPSVRLIAP